MTKTITIFFLMLLMLVSSAQAAYTGVVVNDTGIVQYKFSETSTLPNTQDNESIILRPDIDSILKGAMYNNITHAYTNPKQAAVFPSVPAQKEMPPLDPNIVVISGTGLGISYLMLRRKKAAA